MTTGSFTLGSNSGINNDGSGTKTIPWFNDTGANEDIDIELTSDVNLSGLTQGAGKLTIYTIKM